ncbi:helix-turn-helix domain-containing protein [Georgenia sp. Z1491]|uniref:helix-turn-helix domain-containing protein n=1 Tax=Georgenia sp. Z1491 TaxID=3416707 RepID=UPI003CF40EF6
MARFLTIADVAEQLNLSVSQVRALLRSKELVGVQIGGKGLWRVEDVQLEAYIARLYEQAAARPVDEHVDEESGTGR